jgi:hypothetical protein
MAWFRLCVDVSPDGKVLSKSWEEHDDNGRVVRLSTLTKLPPHGSMGVELEDLWCECQQRSGLIPFP